MNRDIQNDKFEIKQTFCESCKFNIVGCTYCSRYPQRKPADIMVGKSGCEYYCVLDNDVTAGIIGAAVGDALGVPAEFISREQLDINPITDMIGMGTHKQIAGTWSDDTSMTIALIKGLRNKKYDPNFIAQKYIEWYSEGKYTPNGDVFDIGITTRKALDNIVNGCYPLSAGGVKETDNGNGSLMRILPMAYYLIEEKNIDVRKKYVYEISQITHGHIRSKVSCHIWVEFIIQLLYGNTLGEAYSFICDVLSKYYINLLDEDEYKVFNNIFNGNLRDINRQQIRSSGYVVDSLEAAIWCLLNTNSYKSAVLEAVNLGDDTDTIASITGGAAGIVYGLDSIPMEWKDKLVNRMIVYTAATQLYKRCYKSKGKKFKEHLSEYYQMTVQQADDTYMYLKEYSDIYEEYLYFMNKKQFPVHDAICIEGYTAEKLAKETYLQPIGAYNYLIYIRHNPQEALRKLKQGLPRK